MSRYFVHAGRVRRLSRRAASILPGAVPHTALLASAALALAACADDGPAARGAAPGPGGPPSAAYSLWRPTAYDSCSPAVHDAYSVVGPDGKLYPTWHPPVDPATGCTFGHEHGRDPRGSDLYASIGPVPFGVANEALDAWSPGTPRHEDHVGHKIEWENDLELATIWPAGRRTGRCDVLTKLHQGTHSRDAFTNNLHELAYHVRCDDGFELHATTLVAIGVPGEFIRACDGVAVPAGAASPANSPTGPGGRYIPDARCAARMLVAEGKLSDEDAALRELWIAFQRLSTPEGKSLAYYDPAFAVFGPSRFFAPDAANQLGRTVDICYETLADGRRARGGGCAAVTPAARLAYDDPRSPFIGVRRAMSLGATVLSNDDGPTAWYTDPFGGNATRTPFPGSVRQYVSPVAARVVGTGDNYRTPLVGGARDYGGHGVHAPN